MTKREAFATTLAVLFAAFDRPLTELAVKAYWMVLSDLGEAELGIATQRALARCKFMPPPAELLELAGRGSAADVSQAWEAVRRAVDQHDYTTSVDFGPLVNAVVRNIGGWQRLCALKLQELDVWARKEFERVYAAFEPKDPATLNGAPHRGVLAGATVRIAIGGKLPPRALPGPRSEGLQLVRELAEAKS